MFTHRDTNIYRHRDTNMCIYKHNHREIYTHIHGYVYAYACIIIIAIDKQMLAPGLFNSACSGPAARPGEDCELGNKSGT